MAKIKVESRLLLWQNNPRHPQLHMLSGDIRALYQKKDNTYVIFGFIGTHSQLYG